jgi:hypothetical protein
MKKSKINGEVIAKAITDALKGLADTVAKSIDDKKPSKDNGKSDGDGGDSKTQKNVVINVDEKAITKAITDAFALLKDDSDSDGDKVTDADKIKAAISKAAKELGIDENDLQVTIKGIKKSKTNADDDDDTDNTDDEEFIKKLVNADGDDYSSPEFEKKFNAMTNEQKDQVLDNWFSNKMSNVI